MDTNSRSLADDVVITPDDLNNVSSPSPLFLRWAFSALNLNRLEVMVKALLKAGKADNVKEALSYLNHLFTDFPEKQVTVALRDINKPRAAGARYRRLSNLVSGQNPPGRPLAFDHGRLGHIAVNSLFSGELTVQKKKRPEGKAINQLSLFSNKETEETLVLSKTGQYYLPRLLPKNAEEKKEVRKKETRTRDIFRQIEHHFRIVSKAVSGGDFSAWRKKKRNVNCLEKWLVLLFDPLAEQLIQRYADSSRNLLTLTLLTWASLAVYYRRLKRMNRILFREIQVMKSGQGLSGGRADVFEVISVNGRPLSKIEQRVIAGINTEHIKSAGHLIRELIRILGKPLELRIIDWKFLAGDVIEKDLKMELPDIEAEPLSRHLDQVKGYMTLTTFDYRNFRLKNGDGDIWGQDDFRLSGEIWYLVPWGMPIVHQISMTPEEMEKFFTEKYAYVWPMAKWWAEIRDSNNLVVNHLIRLLEKGEDFLVLNHRSGNRSAPVQPLPFEDEEITRVVSLAEVIERHRRKNTFFIDPETRILQVIGTYEDGQQKIRLRFDNVLKAISEEKVQTRHLHNISQFFINCVMPDHHDPGPSLCVSLKKNPPRFKCFGCGVGGRIALDSIPLDIAREMASIWSKTPKDSYKDWAVTIREIPKEHDRIMSLAREIMCLSFWESPAVAYLSGERKIDPHLAYEMGTGFGSENMINVLLDSGYSLDQLIHYGFLGISSRVRPDRGIISALLKRGYKLDELKRESGLSISGKRLVGLPYNVLEGRVTFPLKLRGKYANFYGRILPEFYGRKHVKLSNERTKAEQGGFNMEALESQDQEVLICEGAIDALTWIQLQGKRKNAIAVIGTDNRAIVSETGRTQKTVGPALDWDQSGRKVSLRLSRRFLEIRDRASPELVSEFERAEEEMKTAHKENKPDYEITHRVRGKLSESGVTQEEGGIKDFMAEFVANHPECQERDFDINEWWQRFGYEDAPGKWEINA